MSPPFTSIAYAVIIAHLYRRTATLLLFSFGFAHKKAGARCPGPVNGGPGVRGLLLPARLAAKGLLPTDHLLPCCRALWPLRCMRAISRGRAAQDLGSSWIHPTLLSYRSWWRRRAGRLRTRRKAASRGPLESSAGRLSGLATSP